MNRNTAILSLLLALALIVFNVWRKLHRRQRSDLY